MELSRIQTLLRPLLRRRLPARSRTFQTLAHSPPRPRRLPPHHPIPSPHRAPLILLRPFASVSPAPAPAPGSHHLDCKDHGPPPAPLPPPEDLTSDDEAYYHEHLLEVAQEEQTRVVPVKAFFLCTSIDLRSLQSQNSFNVIPPTSRATNYVVLRYYDVKGDPEGFKSGVIDESHCHYMVVFQYGSIVLFNVSDHEADGYLKIVEKHASGLLPEMRKDDYAVVEKPTLETWMQGGLDHIVLRDLSVDGIRTIGSVLGQSIALDYYIRQVDGMVAEFTDINRGMEKTGTFTMERKKLFQLVGKANSNLADVILKLGLFERSDIAWKNANYAQIWEYLRDEYELTQRFGNLDFKLKFVEHNIRFLQEILQNRKSDFLEWLIIILISVEILISVYNIVQEQM
ncbi:protein RETARDED ROOT GROWTH-LIKE-like [Phragmites australis]|uniref:protein RETARDED ROOT GROWTH-LIKE-like n=1 Tax=Phragmites australis TaxID=29695 RepID=UPI002D78967E|nr:protein RETARDED ROOT GROWTH-LIKE-like [Phragmites australis]